MLTNKEIIESLEKVGYTLSEIASWSKIDEDVLVQIKNGEEKENETVNNNLNQFFRINMSEVEVDKFKDEEFRNSHLIVTPNGCKKCLKYDDKNKQHCYKIILNDFYIVVGGTQQIQLNDDKWCEANQLKVGDKLKVFDGEAEITTIEQLDNINCCSITVEDGEFYFDGIVLK